MITNNCKFIGTVFEISNLSMTNSGKKCCKATISVRVGKDSQGKGIYEYVPCRAYEARAELLAAYFPKGKAIATETHMHRYKAENGITYTEFIIDEIGFVPSDYPQQEEQPAPQPQRQQRPEPPTDYDLPF